MMRNLFIFVALVSLGYSVFWWVGASAKENALNSWFAARRAAGWVAENRSLTVTGYPNRFDTVISGLELSDPQTGWMWRAPQFQILALSYAPNHVIAAWPESQTVIGPGQQLDITSSRMRGSARFEVDTRLALAQSIVEFEDVSVASSLGWTAALAQGQLAIRQSPAGSGPDQGYDVSLTSRDLILPAPVRAAIDPGATLPDAVSRLDLRMTPVFDVKWDRTVLEGPRPALQSLAIDSVDLNWGRLSLNVSGRIAPDVAGFAEGELDIAATNWRDMLDLAITAGLVPADMGPSVENGLGLLALMGGDADRLEVPLRFRGGRAMLGPVPVGPAPRMR